MTNTFPTYLTYLTNPGEIWIQLEDDELEPWYWISNLGRAASSCGSFKILSASKQSAGYLQIGCRRIDKTLKRGYKTLLIHRLVAEYFLQNPEACVQVNHKNGDKTDNTASNLEWTTAQANIIHSFATGLNARLPRVLLHIPTGSYHSVSQALFLTWQTVTQYNAQILYHRVRRGNDTDWALVPNHLLPIEYSASRYRTNRELAA